ncbi:MAG TPA: hypothetical protein VN956_18160 [Pyrinomonadaceae bacterium]|nr:hypothetical protein [Pyrinomonadaceae bacterium]
MANMGKYCKAYPTGRFREFKGWTENTENLKKTREELEGKEIEIQKELTDDSILYLQETFAVTDGIFLDEAVIFDQVTPDWMEFCQTTLGFEVPNEVASAT